MLIEPALTKARMEAIYTASKANQTSRGAEQGNVET